MSSTAQRVEAMDGSDWERIMALSREMLDGARKQEWDRVCELQNDRFKLVRRYFEGSPATEALEGIRADVSALLEMDQEVTELGRKARHELADGIKALRNGRTAQRAYGR